MYKIKEENKGGFTLKSLLVIILAVIFLSFIMWKLFGEKQKNSNTYRPLPKTPNPNADRPLPETPNPNADRPLPKTPK